MGRDSGLDPLSLPTTLHPYPILKEKTPGAQFLKNSTIVDRLGIQNQQALERFRAKNFENSKNKFKAEVVGLVAF